MTLGSIFKTNFWSNAKNEGAITSNGSQNFAS